MSKNNHLVIMAGGIGSRFWPLSSENKPKQFLDVLGVGKTLLQLTLERFSSIVPKENVWIVTSKEYKDLVLEQLPDIERGHVLLEPCRRNTAACICYASWRIKSINAHANIIVAPSDHIIADLEKLRQVEDKKLELVLESVDLLELSRLVEKTFEPDLKKKELVCTVQGESAVVQGDAGRLYQVIYNLLSNAVKYSNEDGQIQIRVNCGETVAELSVEDQGIGISKEDLPLVFERFYRTDLSRNRKTGGAGIGLAIVKAIVEAHHGTVTAESREGRGSKFIVILPVGQPN